MVTRVVSDLMESNTFVVGDQAVCVIVDAGAKVEEVAKAIGKRQVLGVLLTHGHYDHAYFALSYAKQFGCKIYGSKFLREYLENPAWNYSDGHFCVKDFSAFKFLIANCADENVEEVFSENSACEKISEKMNNLWDGVLKLTNLQIYFKQLGGHSKSDMCFKIGDDIFVGDVLIGRDMGRIDLYGADKEAMKSSLQFLLDEKYQTMHSGHGADNLKATQDKVCRLWLKFLSR